VRDREGPDRGRDSADRMFIENGGRIVLVGECSMRDTLIQMCTTGQGP
jgi:hypothetical protein